MKESLDSLVSRMAEDGVFFKDAVGELEKGFLVRALQSTGGNQIKAAEMLGIHRNTLRRKIREYKLGRDLSDGSARSESAVSRGNGTRRNGTRRKATGMASSPE